LKEEKFLIRILSLWIVSAGLLAAQEKSADTLAALRQAAGNKTAEWEALAKGLETKIARLLPCDPRMRADIEEVSRASDARLAALRQYLQAAADKAKDDVETVKSLTASQEELAAQMSAEPSEATQERAGIEGQLADLRESAKRNAALEEALKLLASLAAMPDQRAVQAQEWAKRADALLELLRSLDVAAQAREGALRKEALVLDTEIMRWREYYTARLVRAQTECSITLPAPAPRKKP
jgi:hypothetical protein